ncbi:ATP-grasp domain-containing protein [Xenorhabdus sp. Sc-CR9]|uniref:ATP-grasp domain-containing protein n=1 Tax=Xenorhabdus sp. Sc-CR9 TaxID=2584468 RepID=UPI001F406DDE|nr:ATP-grasp domain-containing protein [Xenorhabdus sp. Sc-CR9]
MKRLALLLHHAGTAPDLIYPSLRKMEQVETITFFIRSPTNKSLNDIYDKVIGTIGPGIECQNELDMIEKFIAYHKKYKIDGVLTFAEMLLKPVSIISKYLHIKFPSPEIIERVQNKAKQRRRLAEQNVPIPRFFEIHDASQLKCAAQSIGFPSLLKPNFGGGGYGIFEVHNETELNEKYREEQSKYENIILEGESSTFNLEEKMIGTSWHNSELFADYVSVESIIKSGQIHHLTVTDRTQMYKPFRESGFITPSSLRGNYIQKLHEITTAALEALELDNMMTHTEIMFTPDGPKIIEVNARPGGTTPFRIGNASNGQYDVFFQLAKLALGEEIDTKPYFVKYAASKVSLCPEGEWLIKFIDFSRVNDIDSIDLVIPIAQRGQLVSSYRGIEDLLGLYYLSNENVHALLADMYSIDGKLYVQYK